MRWSPVGVGLWGWRRGRVRGAGPGWRPRRGLGWSAVDGGLAGVGGGVLAGPGLGLVAGQGGHMGAGHWVQRQATDVPVRRRSQAASAQAIATAGSRATRTAARLTRSIGAMRNSPPLR